MHGALLVNLGTPDAPTTGAVRRYLREFLSDPRVIDLPAVPRALLLYGVILPFRPQKSAAAYRAIWTERGSPLLFHTEDLRDAVAERLGPTWRVAMAMRYGNPPLGEAIASLQQAGVDRIVVLPLYPQYASSSTGSSLERLYALAGALPVTPPLQTVPDFYDHPGFLDAAAAIARPLLAEFQPDHVLMSFHGLPERQIRATDLRPPHCLTAPDCCASIVPANRSCYRAQSYATARLLAQRLELGPDATSVSFQSRLGRTPWIKPWTDEVLVALARRGVRRLAVMCPSFVADCLETLEEIGIRADASFRQAGGEALTLIPCVNSHPMWASAVAGMLREAVGEQLALPSPPS
ncbi:MAG: ferrochelatase [Deltaproteobacteria bacterium]|nr:ferrochelatase [Deltaproteobacteria bacterium]MCB9786611.1 ferrochelatase [Deltaproteobacteria bacterium]